MGHDDVAFGTKHCVISKSITPRSWCVCYAELPIATRCNTCGWVPSHLQLLSKLILKRSQDVLIQPALYRRTQCNDQCQQRIHLLILLQHLIVCCITWQQLLHSVNVCQDGVEAAVTSEGAGGAVRQDGWVAVCHASGVVATMCVQASQMHSSNNMPRVTHRPESVYRCSMR
jgi:hypothetical protein